MDDKLELQERTTAPAGWWEKKFPSVGEWHSGYEKFCEDCDLPALATTEDRLIDPVDAYTARYAFSSGEWDHKIYAFEDQTKEEAIKLCRHPTTAMEEDRRMLYGEAWFGNAYYPFKDRAADTYMKPYQSKEEIERLLKLADTQEKDCVDHKKRAILDEWDAKYWGTNEERFNKSVTAVKTMMEKMASASEIQFFEAPPIKSYEPKPSRLDKLEDLLAASICRISKLEEEVASLKANSKAIIWQ